jgi:hypothetical protein
MAQPHIAGKLLQSSAVCEDLAGHPKSLTLCQSAALADRDSSGILSSVLQIIERFMEVDRGGRGVRIAKYYG